MTVKFAELTELLRETLGAETAQRVCQEICRRAAGESIYVPQRPGTPLIAAHETPAQVAKRFRVSRMTAYRWVERWRQ